MSKSKTDSGSASSGYTRIIPFLNPAKSLWRSAEKRRAVIGTSSESVVKATEITGPKRNATDWLKTNCWVKCEQPLGRHRRLTVFVAHFVAFACNVYFQESSVQRSLPEIFCRPGATALTFLKLLNHASNNEVTLPVKTRTTFKSRFQSLLTHWLKNNAFLTETVLLLKKTFFSKSQEKISNISSGNGFFKR